MVKRISRAEAPLRQASNASQARMTQDVHLIEIVHAGPPKGAVGGRKAGRLDDVRLDAEAGGETENGPRVLGNIGLEQRNAQVWGQTRSRSGRPIL